jgi:hypothetical protein
VKQTISSRQIEKLALPELKLARGRGGDFFGFDVDGG